MRVHQLFALIGGDDWTISAVLLDDTGAPIDLTNATVAWTLINASTRQPGLTSDQFEIDIATDPTTGAVSVTVAADASTGVQGAQYLDYWRVTINEITTTVFSGAITIHSDPWVPPVAAEQNEPAEHPGYSSERVVRFGASRVPPRKVAA